MKKSLLFFFMLTVPVFAMKAFNPPSDNRRDYDASDDTKQQCGKCKKVWGKNFFVPFCTQCDATICSRCNLLICCNKQLFLAEASDYFFVKETCFSCKTPLAIYTVDHSMRPISWR